MINLEELNPEQRTAVTTDERYVLVLAGAGSGKTKVLTTRMAWLIEQGIASPGGILAVTFTNKAAKEMLSRLSLQLPINTRAMWVGTFHGLCNRMLRSHYHDARLPQSFQIMDMQDQLSSIKRVLKLFNIDTEKYPPKEIQSFINNAKEKGARPSDLAPVDPMEAQSIELYHLYQQQCDKEGVVDFPELLLRCYELLRDHPAIREHYQRRFKHILIDEFQDTNNLQYKWLRILAGEQNCIFAVGDDDQSIYSFRGANVGNMEEFARQYAQGNIIRLEQNYRSYNHILHSANALIAENKDRLGKNLWTDRGHGEPLRVNELSTDREEAQWILEEAKSLINEGVDRKEIAVLYRSNAQSRAIEHAFFSAGIPYRVYGGLRFFERQEVKHVLAYLRLINNLDDDNSFLRVVNFPARGIGARTLENLTDAAQKIGCSLALAIGALNGASATKLAQFVGMIMTLKETAKVLTLPDLIQQVIHDTGIETFYQNEREGEERLENLQELVNAAQTFCIEESFESSSALEKVTIAANDDQAFPEQLSALDMFLSYASLEAGDNQAKYGEDAVQLMTVHAAKGLEFKVVFVAGLEEGLFPHENSLKTHGGLEEERRLMYVAITRAKERLYLSGAHERMLYGRSAYTTRSQFLEQIPDEHMKWLCPKTRSYSYSQANRVDTDAWQSAPTTTRKNPFQKGTSNLSSMGSGVQVKDQLFKVGSNVRHAKFGDGVIINLIGQGIEAQALIMFKGVGVKTLALGVAKLEVI
ncbi:DNA-dependent helicase [Pelistega indica]|uniref:DNA 3'-5' helicase n=1 Tax=Pelistega indica TaxID=1414851 RepID=V8G7N4_9BURK|nr:DNA-dependent helicase [Pelistega indica]